MKRSSLAEVRHELFVAREQAIAKYQAVQLERGEYLCGSDQWNSFDEAIDLAAADVDFADEAVECILNLESYLRHFKLLEDES